MKHSGVILDGNRSDNIDVSEEIKLHVLRNYEVIDEIAESVRRIYSTIEENLGKRRAIDGDSTVDGLKPSFRDWLRKTYQDRKFRNEFFNLDYMANEPAWDILLDLAVSRIDRKKISVSSACVASGAPLTTALRWIGLLESDGLVGREADLRDRRRVYLFITDHGIKSMYEYYLRTTGHKVAA